MLIDFSMRGLGVRRKNFLSYRMKRIYFKELTDLSSAKLLFIIVVLSFVSALQLIGLLSEVSLLFSIILLELVLTLHGKNVKIIFNSKILF